MLQLFCGVSTMNNRNIVFPSIVIVLSAIILFVIGQFAEPRFQDASVDAKFFPTVIASAKSFSVLLLSFSTNLRSLLSSSTL